ncbi:MAG: SRPBCC family protein [Desulfohalobiaceae bacterium]|nr:SRPBCC family protein [Desulfohalobiaceae bacterium]
MLSCRKPGIAVIIRETVLIPAPMEIVWDVFSRVENWSEWNPVCRQCRLEAGDCLAAGSCLSFELKPLLFPIRIAPVVIDYEKGRLVTWVGAKWGVQARHSFYFEPSGDYVRIESIEIFSGPMLPVARFFGIPRRLHKLTRHLLAAIQATAETRASGVGLRQAPE